MGMSLDFSSLMMFFLFVFLPGFGLIRLLCGGFGIVPFKDREQSTELLSLMFYPIFIACLVFLLCIFYWLLVLGCLISSDAGVLNYIISGLIFIMTFIVFLVQLWSLIKYVRSYARLNEKSGRIEAALLVIFCVLTGWWLLHRIKESSKNSIEFSSHHF